jgi:ADP-ribosyl-[dinitrogen reductase] hydrolase
MGFVKHAYILAFHFLQRTDLSQEALFDEAMWQTSRLAGDTDTNCCIVGGLIGAYVGQALLPKEKVSKVLSCDLSRAGG